MNRYDQTLKDLSSLSDEKLQSLIRDIGEAVGASPRKTEALTGDLPRVRRTIGGLSEEEAKRLIDLAGKDKAKQIYDAIQRSKN